MKANSHTQEPDPASEFRVTGASIKSNPLTQLHAGFYHKHQEIFTEPRNMSIFKCQQKHRILLL